MKHGRDNGLLNKTKIGVFKPEKPQVSKRKLKREKPFTARALPWLTPLRRCRRFYGWLTLAVNQFHQVNTFYSFCSFKRRKKKNQKNLCCLSYLSCTWEILSQKHPVVFYNVLLQHYGLSIHLWRVNYCGPFICCRNNG